MCRKEIQIREQHNGNIEELQLIIEKLKQELAVKEEALINRGALLSVGNQTEETGLLHHWFCVLCQRGAVLCSGRLIPQHEKCVKTSLISRSPEGLHVYKVRYTNSSTEIPEFPKTPEIAMELLMAANFLTRVNCNVWTLVYEVCFCFL
ncbi:uncharacterized protein LOC121374595 [Gigantopelta aegis]|uniref:uncharacterized protein LOC121374595 n=1 Tax=Gigantopelta aegis TaxID=1735272 RepID=UPI001B88B9CA|nr:uncharacterized protein LOC121374595 [Gigantopelta aegis]